jgi:pilus assembly protein CpaF
LVAVPRAALEGVVAPAAEAVSAVLGSQGAAWLRELRPRYETLRAQRAQNVPLKQLAQAALRQLLQAETGSAAQAIRQGLSTRLSASQLPSEAAIERVIAARPRHGNRLASEHGLLELLQHLTRPASLIAEALAACNQDRRQAYQDQIPETFLPLAVAYLAGWGVLEGLRGPGVTDVMIGARATELARNGRLETVGPGWDAEAIAVYVEQMGGPKPTPTQPLVDWRLPDGSRGNATDATTGEGTLCLRQHPEISLTCLDLLGSGTLTPETHRFLQAAMAARLNLIIAGGTGSGKTTLLKICLDAETLPPGKRGIIIEQEDFELPTPTGLKSFVRWHSGRPTPDRREALTMRQLVTNALRQRPDIIIIGECRGGEVLAMLESANTGHEGTLTTLHANSAKDAIPRLVTLGMSANPHLTEPQLERQIASCFQVVLFLQRDEERDAYVLQEILQLAPSAEPGQTYTTTPLFQSIEVEGRWVCQRTAALLDQRLAARFAAKKISLDWLEGGHHAS